MKTKDKFIDVLPNGKRVEMGIDKNNMYYGEIRDKQGNFEAGTLALSSSEVHNWIYDHCDLLCPVFEIE